MGLAEYLQTEDSQLVPKSSIIALPPDEYRGSRLSGWPSFQTSAATLFVFSRHERHREMTLSSHWFGRRPPKQSQQAAWGARAIFHANTIDLLADRQSWSESTPEGKQRLREWINQTGLPWLRTQVQTVGLRSHDSKVLTHDELGFHIEASPQSSGGYLYIGAWENADCTADSRGGRRKCK